MNFEQQQLSDETVESEGFVPISEFYGRKSKPKPPQTNREKQVGFSVIDGGNGKLDAVVYIGHEVLEELRWRVEDKVAVFIDKKLHKVQISSVPEGQKPSYTLVATKSKTSRVAKFSFLLTEGMGIQMEKVRAHVVPHEIKNISPTSLYGDLVIDVPGAIEKTPTDCEGSSIFEEEEE
jgi:hypothetical protein